MDPLACGRTIARSRTSLSECAFYIEVFDQERDDSINQRAQHGSIPVTSAMMRELFQSPIPSSMRSFTMRRRFVLIPAMLLAAVETMAAQPRPAQSCCGIVAV